MRHRVRNKRMRGCCKTAATDYTDFTKSHLCNPWLFLD
jgi:hypothetical protein